MKIGICDDEIVIVEKIKKLLGEIPELEKTKEQVQIKCYTEGEFLIYDMEELPFDLILMDIDMPRMNGFTLAENIRRLGVDTDIIFITNHDDMVYDAFEYRAYHFLRKSKLEEKFETVLSKWIAEYEETHQECIFEGREKRKVVKIHDIIYAEVKGHEIVLHMRNQEPFTLKARSVTMNQLEEELYQNGFLRVHKSYLVNYQEIHEVTDNDVILKNGENIPVSRDRHKRILHEMHKCIRRRKG